VFYVDEPVDRDGSSDLDPERLSDDDTLSDIHTNAYHQDRRSMIDEWVQSTLFLGVSEVVSSANV
jgi:hypothetical protein